VRQYNTKQDKIIKTCIGILLLFSAGTVATGCRPFSATSSQSFSSIVCLEFRTETPARPKVVKFLRSLAQQSQGKVLVEPQSVYFKIPSPEYYITYDDKMQAYGNLIETYWLDGEGEAIDKKLTDYIHENFSNVGSCAGRRTSSISSFDF